MDIKAVLTHYTGAHFTFCTAALRLLKIVPPRFYGRQAKRHHPQRGISSFLCGTITLLWPAVLLLPQRESVSWTENDPPTRLNPPPLLSNEGMYWNTSQTLPRGKFMHFWFGWKDGHAFVCRDGFVSSLEPRQLFLWVIKTLIVPFSCQDLRSC